MCFYIESQGFIQGVVGGALAPLEKPLTQRMKRCDLVPAPPCLQILYETLKALWQSLVKI